jgi:hypothetical protein
MEEGTEQAGGADNGIHLAEQRDGMKATITLQSELAFLL